MTPYDEWLVREGWLCHEVEALAYYLEKVVEALDEMDQAADAHAANGETEKAIGWRAARCVLWERMGRLPRRQPLPGAS